MKCSLCSITGLLAVFFLVVCTPYASRAQEASPGSLDDIFAQRTNDEWRQVWHTERHRRCYHELQPHLDLACEKDIYRLQKKNHNIFGMLSQYSKDFEDGPHKGGKDFSLLVLTPKRANEFFRQIVPDYRPSDVVKRQRIAKRGIIDECCQGPTGCTWEEYAEYCSAHTRIRP